jgi:hypothetical protein
MIHKMEQKEDTTYRLSFATSDKVLIWENYYGPVLARSKKADNNYNIKQPYFVCGNVETHYEGSEEISYLTINKGFTHDGCSPKIKINVFGKTFIVGTWDGKRLQNGMFQTEHASRIHDCLMQFKEHRLIGITYRQIHNQFLRDLLRSGFPKPLCYLYYVSVVAYTPIHALWNKPHYKTIP